MGPSPSAPPRPPISPQPPRVHAAASTVAPQANAIIEPKPAPSADPSMSIWDRAIAACTANRRLRLLMQESKLEALQGGLAKVLVKPALLTIAQACVADMGTALSQAAGRTITVVIESDGPAPEATEVSLGTPLPSMAEHPLVKQAIELFGGRLLSAGPRKRQG